MGLNPQEAIAAEPQIDANAIAQVAEPQAEENLKDPLPPVAAKDLATEQLCRSPR